MWRMTVLGGIGGGALVGAVLVVVADTDVDGEGEAELDALGAVIVVTEGAAEASDDAVGSACAEDVRDVTDEVPCAAVGRAPPAAPSLSDVGDAAGAHADAAVAHTIKPTKR